MKHTKTKIRKKIKNNKKKNTIIFKIEVDLFRHSSLFSIRIISTNHKSFNYFHTKKILSNFLIKNISIAKICTRTLNTIKLNSIHFCQQKYIKI